MTGSFYSLPRKHQPNTQFWIITVCLSVPDSSHPGLFQVTGWQVGCRANLWGKGLRWPKVRAGVCSGEPPGDPSTVSRWSPDNPRSCEERGWLPSRNPQPCHRLLFGRTGLGGACWAGRDSPATPRGFHWPVPSWSFPVIFSLGNCLNKAVNDPYRGFFPRPCLLDWGPALGSTFRDLQEQVFNRS